ncbi:MAG: DUF5362 family protein [Acidobacteriia bacterium]|nr:DUF5362 family protein [Terriglobia bacterium]
MKVIGNLFIAFGVLLCLSIIFFMPGLLTIAVGALLRMSSRR